MYSLNPINFLSFQLQVKKYNYDLVEYFSNNTAEYAVCSLACLPKSADYLKTIRGVLYLPQPTSEKAVSSGSLPSSNTNNQEIYQSRVRRKEKVNGTSIQIQETRNNNSDESK